MNSAGIISRKMQSVNPLFLFAKKEPYFYGSFSLFTPLKVRSALQYTH